MRKRPEDVHNPGISGARSDQPPGRILTTPVETVVEAGLTDLVFLHILILLEAASPNHLEAEINLLQEETTDRVETGPGLETEKPGLEN